MFGALKLKLDAKPVIHKHAGAFVGDLKMLMAKLKVLVSYLDRQISDRI